MFKEAKYIETLANADIVVFDKTGTLTKGELEVSNINLFKDDEKEFKSSLFFTLIVQIILLSIAVKKYIKKTIK